MEDRVKKALDIAISYGGIDGAHHKDWVIDQMVRALTGCPIEKGTALDVNKKVYEYERQGVSEEYAKLIAEACDGEDGPETYSWEEGIAP
jgi:hypothetical protein